MIASTGRRVRSAQVVVAAFVAAISTADVATAQKPISIIAPKRTDAISFQRDLMPIFRKKCLACHSASEGYGDLVMETPAGLLKGGDTGPSVVPRKSDESLLLKVASHREEPFMPPPDNDVAAPPLTGEELGLIQLWIDQGANGDDEAAAISPKKWRPLPPGVQPIYATAISPDGQYAACGRANQIFIYHVPTGQLITRLNDPSLQLRSGDPRPGIAHLDVVQSLAFNPKGDMLASGGFRTVKLWRRPSDVRRLEIAVGDGVTAVAVNPAGDIAATALADKSIKLWNVADGAARGSLAGHEDVVTSLKFSHDGASLYSSSLDKTVRIWNTADGALAGRIDVPSPVQSLAVLAQTLPPPTPAVAADAPAAEAVAANVAAQPAAPDATGAAAVDANAAESDEAAKLEIDAPVIVERLATGGADNLIRLWNVPHELPRAWQGAPAKPTLAVTDPVRGLVATANAEGLISVQLSDGTPIAAWQAHAGAVLDVAFRPLPPPAPADQAAAASAPAANAEPVPAAAAAGDNTEGAVGETEKGPAPFELATCGADGVVRIWRIVANGAEETMTLRGSLTPVRAIAFRPDGLQLVAGAEDGAATIWKLEAMTTREIAAAASPDAAPQQPPAAQPAAAAQPVAAKAMAVSADRKRMAIADVRGDRPAIVVRDVATGRITHELLGHEGPIAALAFNADGARLASASADGTARVWDLNDPKFAEIARLVGHEGTVAGVAFSADGTQVVSGGADKSVRLWNVAEEKELMAFAGHEAAVVAVAMGASNQPISASADKTVRVWNPANGAALRSIALTDAAASLAVTADGAQLAVATADKKIHVFTTANGAAVKTWDAHAGSIHSVQYSGDGTRLVSAGDENEARVWTVADGRLLEAAVIDDGLAGAVYGETLDSVIIADGTGAIAARPLRFALALPGMAKAVTKAAYSADGQIAITASLDGIVHGFNTTNGQQVYAANHGAPVRSLAMSADRQRMASAGEDKLIKLWNPANGAALQPAQLVGFATAVGSVAFSGDGRHIVGADAETAELLVFDAVSGAIEQRLVGHGAAISAVAPFDVPAPVDPAMANAPAANGANASNLPGVQTGHRMLSVSADESLLVWSLVAERQIAGHTQPVTSLASVPVPADQPNAVPRLLSGSTDGTVREWDSTTGQVVRQLNHGGPVTGVAVRPDGQRYASTSANNTAKLWNATNNQQIAEMRGDVRALSLAAQLTQDKAAQAARVQTTMQTLTAAEQDLPTKTAAAKTAADALTAANTDVTAKQTALKAASDVKAAAEKVAIEAAAVAQKALTAKNAADEQVALAMAEMTAATEAMQKAQTAAQSDPNNTTLAQNVVKAQAAVTAADTKVKTAQADQATKLKSFTDASAAAADAATKAVATNKPFTDAAAALQTSEQTQNTAAQTSALAERELKDATDLVPALKKDLDAANLRMTKIDTDLTAAQAAAQAAEKPFLCVAFSPDGQQLATGGEFASVHTWDAESGKAVASHVGHAGPVASIAYVGGDALLSGSSDKTAPVWDMNPGWVLERTIGSIDTPNVLINRVTAVAFSGDGKLLATGGGEPSRSGELKVWKVADGAPVLELPDAHTDAVFGVAFSPDGEQIVSGGADKYLRTFRIADGDQIRTFEGHTDHVLSVHWRADGRALASCGADNTLRIWNPDTADRIQLIEGFTKQVSSVRFIGQSVNTISCSADKTVRMHNSDNGQNFRNFAGGVDFMYAADSTPDGGIVVAGGYDSVLMIWNGQNAQLLHSLAPPQEPTDEVASSGEVNVDGGQAAK